MSRHLKSKGLPACRAALWDPPAPGGLGIKSQQWMINSTFLDSFRKAVAHKRRYSSISVQGRNDGLGPAKLALVNAMLPLLVAGAKILDLHHPHWHVAVRADGMLWIRWTQVTFIDARHDASPWVITPASKLSLLTLSVCVKRHIFQRARLGNSVFENMNVTAGFALETMRF